MIQRVHEKRTFSAYSGCTASIAWQVNAYTLGMDIRYIVTSLADSLAI